MCRDQKQYKRESQIEHSFVYIKQICILIKKERPRLQSLRERVLIVEVSYSIDRMYAHVAIKSNRSGVYITISMKITGRESAV